MNIKNNKTVSQIALILLLIVFSAVFTFSSVVWDTDSAYTPEDFFNLSFGWPVDFYEASFLPDEDGKQVDRALFPIEVRGALGADEYRFTASAFWLGVFVNFILFYFLWFIVKRILNSRLRKPILIAVSIFKKVLIVLVVLLILILISLNIFQYATGNKIFAPLWTPPPYPGTPSMEIEDMSGERVVKNMI